jgi:hypothetical protein
MASLKYCETKFTNAFEKAHRKRHKQLCIRSSGILNSYIKLTKEKGKCNGKEQETIDGKTNDQLDLIELEYYLKSSQLFIKDMELVIMKKTKYGIETKQENKWLKVEKKAFIESEKKIKALKTKLLKPAPPITKEEREKILQKIADKIKSWTIINDEYKSETLLSKEEIREMFCNPTCKGTLYEDGDKLSDEYKHKMIERYNYIKNKYNIKNKTQNKRTNQDVKIEQNIILDGENRRKNLFSGKRSIINDGFYNKISKKLVEKMRDVGAVSGCYQPFFSFDIILYTM